MTKNSSFLRFMATFLSYFPQFWDSTTIYNDRKARYIFVGMTQKSSLFVFYGHFHEVLPIFLVSRGIRMARMTRYTFERYDQKLVVFAFYGRFMSYCPRFWGYRAIYMSDRYDHRFCVLWLFSLAISLSFGVPGQFTCFRVTTKN